MKEQKEQEKATRGAGSTADASPAGSTAPTDSDTVCPRCWADTERADIIDGRCGECRLHEDEADWTDEAEGPLN